VRASDVFTLVAYDRCDTCFETFVRFDWALHDHKLSANCAAIVARTASSETDAIELRISRGCDRGGCLEVGSEHQTQKFGQFRPIQILILNLILAVINWVEGDLKFTYVESKWGCVENTP
jgi:hypothetical protein